MKDEAISALTSAANDQIATLIVDKYMEIEAAHSTDDWKIAGLDAGHFVEAVRRFLDIVLFGASVPIGKSLGAFHQKELLRLEGAKGDDAYRLHIPRALQLIYGIRNKRGIGHLSEVAANRQDSSMVLQVAKWVLAELVRLNSNLGTDETSALVDRICHRNVAAIWFDGEKDIVLSDNLSLKHQIIVVLYSRSTGNIDQLRVATNSQTPYLKRTINTLIKEKVISKLLNEDFILSPKGAEIFENKIRSLL